jgi:hypothetical protein
MASLVDTSLWLHQLRRSGDPAQRARVVALLEAGRAAWPDVKELLGLRRRLPTWLAREVSALAAHG